ncbi:hypothetical protein L210DRAFT_986931 [Boletus edulis BED1]|uniref:Uncharacterized protein n=1 Tax=Boletus edulis BED1 TaxID=1328754 RepID=A0AAD4BK26_BOLED|nr:hypothetical protein L210DRAFT_986931 [Boletus edulis BED1]
MRISSSLVYSTLYLSLATAAVISNVNGIASRDPSGGLINLDDLRVPVHVPVNVEVNDNKILK